MRGLVHHPGAEGDLDKGHSISSIEFLDVRPGASLDSDAAAADGACADEAACGSGGMVSRSAGGIGLDEHVQARSWVLGAELRVGAEVAAGISAADGVALGVAEEIRATPRPVTGAGQALDGIDDNGVLHDARQ